MEIKDQRPDLVDHQNDQRAYSSVEALLLDCFKSTTCAIKFVQSIRPHKDLVINTFLCSIVSALKKRLTVGIKLLYK